MTLPVITAMTQRIGVALSGGADSALAASLLLSSGSRVFGVHMVMTHAPHSLVQLERARRIASQLDIDLQVTDVADSFEARVIGPFCDEYAAGRTPNPCVTCNREIKFGLLLRTVLESGADKLATGHFARVVRGKHGIFLQRALDRSADQSYFLYGIEPSSLPYVEMPLGTISRSEARDLARGQGLARGKPSQDICFVGGRDYRSFVAKRVCATPGEIVDLHAHVVGRHQGLPYYTVGQRHGLGIALGEPMYVVRLDVRQNKVVVGPDTSLVAKGASLSQMRWMVPPPSCGRLVLHSQTRFRARSTSSCVTIRDGEAYVRFGQPQRAVAPGQSVVFYDGDVVVGGGTIVEAYRESRDAAEQDSSERR